MIRLRLELQVKFDVLLEKNAKMLVKKVLLQKFNNYLVNKVLLQICDNYL